MAGGARRRRGGAGAGPAASSAGDGGADAVAEPKSEYPKWVLPYTTALADFTEAQLAKGPLGIGMLILCYTTGMAVVGGAMFGLGYAVGGGTATLITNNVMGLGFLMKFFTA